MRESILLWLGLGAVVCGISHGEETFPYRLTVVNEGVPVHSGPGETFYVTDHLAAGSSIEVYRHHEGGWLGIRPPAGSFSWVPGDRLAETDQPGIARVLSDDTICRVGSRVEEIKEHTGQIYLEKDELVELPDLPPVDTRTARQLEKEGWRRITPPAGEFRWVQAADLQRAHGSQAGSRLAAGKRPAAAACEPVSAVRQVAHVESKPDRAATITTAEVIQAVALQATSGEDESRPTPSESEAARDAADSPAPKPIFEEREPAAEEPVDESASWVSRGGVPIDDLLDVEMRLTSTAAREVHRWRLQPLRDRVESVLPGLKTEAERQQAKRLLDRIAEYEKLQNRFARAGEIAPLTEAEPLRGSTGAVTPPDWEDGLLSRFDGSGWLVPVHSTRRVAPPYALLDDEGEVLQYVAPSPGLNLHRYLRKRVGLYGQRGYAQTLNKPLITAERVVDLGRHLR